jgi:hypothetical protein
MARLLSMSIIGFGLFPCGLYPAGFGQDPVPDDDAQPEGVRFIDPRTKDYALDTDGALQFGSPEMQRVVAALTTAFGSSMAVRGILLPERHDETTQQITTSEVRTVLAPIVNDGSIVIDRIKVVTEADRVPGRLGVDVGFINTSTGELETARA